MNFLDKKYYAVYNYNYIFINRLMKGGRSVWVHPLPISIPFARFNQLAGSAAETTCAADTQVTSKNFIIKKLFYIMLLLLNHYFETFFHILDL